MSADVGATLAFEAVDRSGSWCFRDADGSVHEGSLDGRPAAAELPLALDAALRRHGRPERLAVAMGPGSFTGLRVAVVAARTLAWCEQLPLVGVDSLAAIACAQGPGLWWVLLPLKGDTTFHALVEVGPAGHQFLAPSAWSLDAATPALHPRTVQAVAIGPALAQKPELAREWCPGVALGRAVGCTARGVLKAAEGQPGQDWRELAVAYHIPSAPELQRASRTAPPPER